MNSEEWIAEELRARNNQILATHRSFDQLFHFTLLLLAAVLIFLGSSTYRGAGDWIPSVFFASTLLFASLGSRYLYYLLMDGVMSKYIQERLVPRLGEIYTNSDALMYEWEEYIGNQRRSIFWYLASPFVDMGVFALPTLGFFGCGVFKLTRFSNPSTIQAVAAYVLLVLCAWSLGGAVSIGLKARKLLM